jgi:acyl carrier protein
MFEIVQEIVYQVTGKTGLTMDTDFLTDLELNSFDVMNIVCAFEDHFDTTIPTRDVWKLRRVCDVLDYMEEHGITEP